MARTRIRHFTRVSDLTPESLEALLDVASALKAAPGRFDDALRGESIACLFDRGSTQARVSFAAAAARLGAEPITLRAEELELGRGGPLADTARALSGYVAAIVVRAAAQATVDELARWASVPVVNACSDEHHPCQALADLLTVRELFGSLRGRRLAFVGDGRDPVAHSLLEAGALAGMEVTLACPPDRRPDPAVLAGARELAAGNGAALRLAADPADAVGGAEIVYAGVWDGAAGDGLRRTPAPYHVSHELLTLADADAIFLHSLPARRGEEVAAAVIDGPQSAVWRQSANRLPTEAALLLVLVEGFDEEIPRAGSGEE